MTLPRQLAETSLLSVLTLVVGLTVPAASQADNKQKPPPGAKGGPAKPAAKVSPFQEAQVLRQAYIVLAGANHDYNGHRVKAMQDVKAALHILDEHVMKHGSAADKAATKQGNTEVAQADAAAKRTPLFHEPQPVSDRAMRQGNALLVEVQGILARQNQKRVLAHVDAALKQVAVALKVR
jgi:hypothetical protein